VLAICRGFELLAVAYGGRLYQHLPDVLGHTDHRPAAVLSNTVSIRYGSRPAPCATRSWATRWWSTRSTTRVSPTGDGSRRPAGPPSPR
jgi:gamma-glutamyl-gamma-aminobutyrate hydrolase PuuD